MRVRRLSGRSLSSGLHSSACAASICPWRRAMGAEDDESDTPRPIVIPQCAYNGTLAATARAGRTHPVIE